MKKANVLLVDDEVAFVRTFSKLLIRRGYTVMTSHDGPTAISIIEEHDIDVVLLDLWMPGMNGIETLREIKARKPEIQVVILTGHMDVESALDALSLEAFDFRAKTTQPLKLLEQIDQAFQKKLLNIRGIGR